MDMIHSGDSIESRNKEIIRAAFEKWIAGTGGVFDLLVDEAPWTIVGNAPVSRTYSSKKEFIDEVISPFAARMSTRFVPTVPALYADNDMVIAFFNGAGTALDGKPYKNTYTWYLRMKAGKIIEVVAFFDTIEFTDFWTRIKLPAAASGR
jgi:uncharacterized protein